MEKRLEVEAELESEDRARDPSGPRGATPFPLNSKRLTAPVLKQIAGTLGVPDTAALDEIRQMIDGKLLEMGREPRNTQVVLGEAAHGIHICLQDADGTFLELESAEVVNPPEEGGEGGGAEDGVSDTETLRRALQEANSEKGTLLGEVNALKAEIERTKERVKEMWRANCAQLSEFDATLLAKDDEIAQLKRQLAGYSGVPREISPGRGDEDDTHSITTENPPEIQQLGYPSSRPFAKARRGKAPPVDSFTGENEEIGLDDWLPALQRASSWNGWTEEDLLIQMAGNLRGKALQEWELLEGSDKKTFKLAADALRARLDPGSKTLAAQDFRHTSQMDGESVSTFIRRLERTFRLAYGRDRLGPETRDALLYGQLHEGLRYDIMKGPAVAGAQSYPSLCIQ